MIPLKNAWRDGKIVVTVREVAEQLIWQCLVEDPALFLRTFLEKLTNRDRRVSETWWDRKGREILSSQLAQCCFNLCTLSCTLCETKDLISTAHSEASIQWSPHLCSRYIGSTRLGFGSYFSIKILYFFCTCLDFLTVFYFFWTSSENALLFEIKDGLQFEIRSGFA